MTGAPGGGGGGDGHTSAVNEDLDVSTHSERSPSHSLRRGIVGTNVRASLRVSCQEKSQAGALCQNVGKITIIHLKDPRSEKKYRHLPNRCFLCQSWSTGL